MRFFKHFLRARPSDLAPSATTSGIAKIRTERTEIHADFDHTARKGYVPADALIGRLYANHCEELAEDLHQLDALEQELEARVRSLDAMFPAPLPPEPVKPAPPRVRHFGPISADLFAKQETATRH